jgi:hypothetical protein
VSSINVVAEMSYNRNDAKLYAEAWCNKYNPAYINYASANTDCANFASQALIEGGLSFGCVKNSDIIGKDGITKGETGAASLITKLQESFCFMKALGNGKQGDIVAYKDAKGNIRHVGILDENGHVAAHTNPHCFSENLSPERLFGSTLKSYEIWTFPDDDKSKKCERNWDSLKTCKAELKDRSTACEIYDPISGMTKPKCPPSLGGRCAATVSCEVVRLAESEMGICKTSPSGDCPDDTLTVGTGAVSDGVMPSTNPNSNVAILENGYPYDMYKLLSSFGRDARIIKTAELSPDMEVSLLIIPTGGLNGMENSEFFKLFLDEYVKRGGKILVLSQQSGNEFSALPGGIAGYGWSEDQSCFSNSSYIDTWHNVLAGQTKSTPTLNVDGYFSKYPTNSTVLLRRTANGQPALIIYPYGNGYVIAGTSFTDWAYATGQASEEERRLIRDIVTWAKSPATLTEIKPGETATVNLIVANHDESATATAAEIELYDPDRKEVKLRTKVPVALAPGQSAQILISYTTTAADPLGIYNIRYGLLTEGYQLLTSEIEPDGVNIWLESLLQPPAEEPSGRFVVSNPPANPYKSPDFNMTINVDQERYIYGDDATFTVTLWNNTASERTLTVHYWDYHLNVSGSPKTMTIPARSSASFEMSAICYARGLACRCLR